jgi:lactoylglutathione lyase
VVTLRVKPDPFDALFGAIKAMSDKQIILLHHRCMTQIAVNAIAHWALKTSNLDRLLAFYRDTLGFAEMMRLYKDDGSTWLVYLRITDTQYLELFPDGDGAQAPGWEDTAMHHICLDVADIDATAADLEKRGVKLAITPKLGLDGNRQCWIEDPDGNRVEFMQMLPGNMQDEAIKRMRAKS